MPNRVAQRGAIPPFLIPWLIKGVGALIVLGAVWWVWHTWNDGRAAIKQVAAIEDQLKCKGEVVACVVGLRREYDDFVDKTAQAGIEAEKKQKAEIARQREVSNARIKGLEDRLAASNARFARLRADGEGSRGGIVPPVPSTAVPTDDSARDQRLFDVLRHAQEQTDRLIELQQWIRESANR